MAPLSVRFLSRVAAVALLAGCLPRPRVVTDLPDSLAALAFDAVLTQNGSGVRVSVYCVGYAQPVGGPPHWKYADPSPVITRQLAGPDRDVRAYSGCPTRQETIIGRLVDTTTGAQVMVLTLQDSIQWARDTLIVWGGYDCGGLCGGRGPVRLWRRDGKWHALFTIQVVS
jgi:hypothetical protein